MRGQLEEVVSKLKILSDPDALARAAADRFAKAASAAIARRGKFSVALAGGSTPRGAYQQLATPDLAGRMNWRKVHLFWGDERCVPPEHPESNYRMARETFLADVPVPQANIHRMQGELDPLQAAAAYETALRAHFGAVEWPPFDLILLGMGEDGHIASLFPESPAMHEAERWVVAHFLERLQSWRITLTLPAINAARQVVFLVAGLSKASRLREVLRGDPGATSLPAAQVRPTNGELVWMVDQAAASQL
ncbi:MAG: 6-phosphogluconolactonase [Chloroflexota bacterium]